MSNTKTVFLLDVDNTLLDNDRFAADFTARMDEILGGELRQRYWDLFNKLRAQLGYADYLGAVQLLRLERESDLRVLQLSAFLLDYPFAERLYPQSLEAIAHLKSIGTTAILSDGDAIFQPHKIQRAGLWRAVDQVLIYVHKEKMLDEVQKRLPANRYVMVDDKPNLLTMMKRILGDRLTTVFVRQGHYARDADMTKELPPDLTIERIGDLVAMRFA